MRTAVFDPFLYKHSPPPFILKPVAHGGKKTQRFHYGRRGCLRQDLFWKEDEVPFKKRNNILVGASEPIDYTSLGNLILKAFKYKPKFIGQINAETGEEVTFQQMREKSVKLALWLQKLGIRQNNMYEQYVITICTNNQMQVYSPLLASIYLNAVVNIWDTKYLADPIRFLYFLLENSPDIIFVDDENFIRVKVILIYTRIYYGITDLPRIISLGNKTQKNDASLDSILDSEFDQFEVDKFTCTKNIANSTAIIIFSSNTTNFPGDARISYEAFLSPSNEQTPIMKSNDVGLWYGSINWTHNLLLTIRAIFWYVTAIKLSRDCTEENLSQIVEKYKVTWVFLESNICNKLFNTDVLKKYDVSSLKQVLFGDTTIRHEVHESLIQSLPNVSIIQVYGLSETGVIAYQRNTGKIGSSGYVSKNVQLMFVDLKTRKPVGPNTCGEIWCQTPSSIVLSDRIKMIESEYDTKRTNEGWYYTGDVGYFDEDGDIFVIGKSRDVIKYRNFIILSTKIEEVLLRHPAVSKAAVVGVMDIIDGNHPKAFVIKEPGGKVTKKELMKFVEDNMDSSCILRGGLHFLNAEMPYLPNGKIDRLKLLNMPREAE